MSILLFILCTTSTASNKPIEDEPSPTYEPQKKLKEIKREIKEEEDETKELEKEKEKDEVGDNAKNLDDEDEDGGKEKHDDENDENGKHENDENGNHENDETSDKNEKPESSKHKVDENDEPKSKHEAEKTKSQDDDDKNPDLILKQLKNLENKHKVLANKKPNENAQPYQAAKEAKKYENKGEAEKLKQDQGHKENENEENEEKEEKKEKEETLSDQPIKNSPIHARIYNTAKPDPDPKPKTETTTHKLVTFQDINVHNYSKYCQAKYHYPPFANRFSLVSALIFFRHGDRVPISPIDDVWSTQKCIACKGDADTIQDCQERECKPGDLTLKGYSQTQKLGEFIAHNYNQLTNKIKMICVKEARIEASLFGVMSGIKEIDKVEVTKVAKDEYILTTNNECPKLQFKKVPILRKFYNHLITKLKKHFKSKKITKNDNGDDNGLKSEFVSKFINKSDDNPDLDNINFSEKINKTIKQAKKAERLLKEKQKKGKAVISDIKQYEQEIKSENDGIEHLKDKIEEEKINLKIAENNLKQKKNELKTINENEKQMEAFLTQKENVIEKMLEKEKEEKEEKEDKEDKEDNKDENNDFDFWNATNEKERNKKIDNYFDKEKPQTISDNYFCHLCQEIPIDCDRMDCLKADIKQMVMADFKSWEEINENLVGMDTYLKIIFGKLANKMITMLNTKQLYLIGCHDSTISSILTGLKSSIAEHPPYATAVFIEVLEDSKGGENKGDNPNLYIRIIYNNKTVKIGVSESVYIPFDDLVKYLEILAIDEEKRKVICNTETEMDRNVKNVNREMGTNFLDAYLYE